MIYTVTLNPALDKTVQIPNFRPGEVNRIAALRTDPGGKGINVSKVLHALAEPNVAAAILGGAAGQRIADALQAIGVEGLFLFTQHETRTNLKLISMGNCTSDIVFGRCCGLGHIIQACQFCCNCR